MRLNRERLLELLALIERTQEHELDCDAFLQRLPAYLEQRELMADASTLDAAYAELLQHLRVCPECLEEFEALLRARGDGTNGA